MYILNIKLDMKKISIICILVAILSAFIIQFVSNNNTSMVSKNNEKYDYILNEENYTKMLKIIHDDIDGNINKTIKMSGFIYRAEDFKEDYFVCGRNIIVNDETNVAGILCTSKEWKNLKDNEWIEITGIITLGDYNGRMPTIKVSTIKKIETPKNIYVK